MTVMFGSVEFFEREITNYLNENQLNEKIEAPLTNITSKLEDEILHDFICDETIRIQCCNNLNYAIDRVRQSLDLYQVN